MIKKTILMLLVLVGGVVSANAGTIKKRIFIQYQLGGTAALYMYKKDDVSIKPLGAWPGTLMTQYNSAYENWYFVDVDLDENTDYVIIANNNNNGVQSKDIDYNSNTNKFYSIWGNSNDSGNTYNVNDLTYYLYDATNSTISLEMTLDENLNLSTTIDNTGGEANKDYVIAPSFVTAWYGNDSKRWNMMIRPYADYQTLSFNYITSDQQYAKIFVATDNSNAWKPNNIKAKFDLTVDLANWTYSVSPYFIRTIKAAESNGAYYATFSSDYAVAIPSGITAYWADGSQTVSNSVQMTSFTNGIPAGVGAFIKMATVTDATNGDGYTFTPAASTDNVTEAGDLLKKTKGYTYDSSKNRYVFAKQGTDVGFYKAGSSYNPSEGKAYLELPTTTGDAPSLSIELDGETTGIKVVNANSAETIGNGQLFDLQGRRVAEPTKGIYIVNGKKVIVK